MTNRQGIEFVIKGDSRLSTGGTRHTGESQVSADTRAPSGRAQDPARSGSRGQQRGGPCSAVQRQQDLGMNWRQNSLVSSGPPGFTQLKLRQQPRRPASLLVCGCRHPGTLGALAEKWPVFRNPLSDSLWQKNPAIRQHLPPFRAALGLCTFTPAVGRPVPEPTASQSVTSGDPPDHNTP